MRLMPRTDFSAKSLKMFSDSLSAFSTSFRSVMSCIMLRRWS